MKLEYLASSSSDCPLIRLFDFTRAEAAELCSIVAKRASGELEEVAIDELPFVTAIEGCRLTLVASAWDAGVVQEPDGSFSCRLSPATWDNVAALIEPFANDATGYQWLVGMPGDAAILLSVNGQW
jgi:hypothetical protein